jgi:DNA-binding GntR family transcriptional regulator
MIPKGVQRLSDQIMRKIKRMILARVLQPNKA